MEIRVSPVAISYGKEFEITGLGFRLEFLPKDEAEHDRLLALIGSDTPEIQLSNQHHADKLELFVAMKKFVPAPEPEVPLDEALAEKPSEAESST